MTTDDEIIKEIMQSPNEFIFNSPLDLEEDIIKLLKEAIQKSRENCLNEVMKLINSFQESHNSKNQKFILKDSLIKQIEGLK